MPIKPKETPPVQVLVKEVRDRLVARYAEDGRPVKPGEPYVLRTRLRAAMEDVGALLLAVEPLEKAVNGMIHGFAVAYGGNEHVEGAAKNLSFVIEQAVKGAVDRLTAEIVGRREVIHLRQTGSPYAWCRAPGRQAETPAGANCVDCLRAVAVNDAYVEGVHLDSAPLLPGRALCNSPPGVKLASWEGNSRGVSQVNCVTCLRKLAVAAGADKIDASLP